MASTYTASLRLELQGQGENPNTWGAPKLNNLITRMEYAVAGCLTKALTGNYTLTSENNADDEARAAILKFTGGPGPFTVTIPSVAKEYKVWNACSGNVVITTGAGAAVTVQPTEIAEIICDGANVKATGYNGLTEKSYVDTRLSEAGAMPAGAIIMWSGSVASIPAGYVLCNGSNGTPNLQDRFVVGAGGGYAVGASGGLATVTLSAGEMPSHAHSATTSFESADHSHAGYTAVGGSHAHTFEVNLGGGATPRPANTNAGAPVDVITTAFAGAHDHVVQTYGQSANHYHTLTTTTAGSGGAHENRPPYYALCFIMKT